MSLKDKKVLLVDDDPDFRMIARHILEGAGLSVDEAESVDEGLEKIQSSPPHVLLTDLHMPEKTGFDLIEELRERDYLKSLPVIVLSSLSDVPSVRKAIALGVTDYVVKPIKAPILLRKLRKIFLSSEFIKIDLPLPLSAEIIIESQISMIGEAGFQVLAPVKIKPLNSVFIESRIIEELNTKYQSSPLPRRYIQGGIYCNDFLFTGIQEVEMQKIRTWMAQWRQKK